MDDSDSELALESALDEILKVTVSLSVLRINSETCAVSVSKFQCQLAALVKLRCILCEYLVSDLGWVARVVAELTVEPPNRLVPDLHNQLTVRLLRMCGY